MKLKSNLIAILPFLFLFLFTSCIQKSEKKNNIPSGKAVILNHAEGFSITQKPDYTQVTVFNPWREGEIYDRYYLVKDECTEVPADGKKVLIPLRSIVANSATHLEFLQMLGLINSVAGICNAQYIYNPEVLQGVKDGKIKDLGDAFNLDIESLLLLHPQAVMASAYNAKDENSKKMEQTGLTILYNIEWQEKSLLGRAEWIKFIGAFFDKQELADSLFREVEEKYNAVKREANACSDTPSILSGQDFRGTWSMPGGKSFTAQLFRDAGIRYFYASDKAAGSISSNIENALINFGEADIWIGTQANTLEELGKTETKYKLFKAYRNGKVYNYNNRTNASGGNDYWESAVARPDLLLMDMIKVAHPELLPGYELTYMQKLKP